jgi:Zn-finger nucleic acid-binding protein
MRTCPRCNVALGPTEYEGVQIDKCPRCGGEWLDAGELKHIVDTREHQWDPKDLAAMRRASLKHVSQGGQRERLTCPGCGAALEPVNYGGDTGIIIDHCQRCGGNWLDGGELEKVQQVVEAWDDNLGADLKRYGTALRAVADREEVRSRQDVARAHTPGASVILNSILGD